MRNLRLLSIIVLGALASAQCRFNAPPQLGKASIKEVIGAMSLEEKAYFVTGTGSTTPGTPASGESERSQNAPVVGSTQKLVPGAAGTSYAIPRLGIPAMVMADGPAGLRIAPKRDNDNSTYYCTAFPVATLLASTWDQELTYKVGQAIGSETLEYGVDILLGPAMNIHRNPLCGRNFEYYAEDPLIAGKIAAAMVNGVESRGVGTSIKHFAANNTETNRNVLDTLANPRALREVYLEGYRIAVEDAQPWTVMSSYNLINGVPASESVDLLTTVLRKDWGFQGFVMTDWFGGIDAAAQMAAGNDLLMPGTVVQANSIIRAVREKRLDEKLLDRNIEKILNVLVKTPRFMGYKHSNRPDLKAHALIARQSAAEGMVLLKNAAATLPIARDKRLAVFGNTSYETITGGTGSGDVNEAYTVSIAAGLANAGFRLDRELEQQYGDHIEREKQRLPKPKPFMPQRSVPEMAVAADLAGRVAQAADVAVITLGRNSGEFFDRKIEADFELTPVEHDLVRTVSNAFHQRKKNVIVVLNIGGVVETKSWNGTPDAILLAWQGGQETGNSVADVISGAVNPSGKLASTFPVRYQDVSSSRNFPGTVIGTIGGTIGGGASDSEKDDGLSAFRKPKPSRIVYEEGIYVGYRYHESFGVAPAYEFGYGLSYTSFQYGPLSLSSNRFSDEITATLDVTNTGKTAGKEVVQLYLVAPTARMHKPAIELKGFMKTRLLNAGEKQTVRFVLKPRQLASFDAASSSWIADAGSYQIKIGASSRDIRQRATFDLDKTMTVKRENRALLPAAEIKEMAPAR